MNTGSLNHPQQQKDDRKNQQQMNESTESESRQERKRPEAKEYDCNSFEHQESSMSGPKAGCCLAAISHRFGSRVSESLQ
jgi:hypothetical protein